jgi:hypothetical protein
MKITDDMLIQFQDQNVAGMPRPLGRTRDGAIRPVPYTQSGTDWGVIDTRRKHFGMDRSLCLVCGETVEEGFVLWVRINSDGVADPLENVCASDLAHARISDNGPLHDRCLKITRAHCRRVRTDIANGLTIVLPYRLTNSQD